MYEGAILFRILNTSHAISFILLVWSGYVLFSSKRVCKGEVKVSITHILWSGNFSLHLIYYCTGFASYLE